MVYENNGLKITVFEVDHGRIKPAYGYRIDYAGRSVVLSGDTRFNENVIRFSQGVDLLVHEVIGMSNEFLQKNEFGKTIASNHTTPQDAGEVFRRANPKLAVFTHILFFGDYSPDDLVTSTRKNYSGPLEVGEDLMSIELGEKTKIIRPSDRNA